MPVIATAQIYTGVVGLPITLTFKDETNDAIDISASEGTIVVKVRRPKGNSELSYSGASVSLTDPTNGVCKITTTTGQFATPGVYKVQGWFTRTSPAGVFPSDELHIQVRPSPTTVPA
jgi:hypothetical protein